MTNRGKAEDDQEKVRTHLPREIPSLPVNGEPWKQSFRDDFGEVALPRFPETTLALPIPESPIDGDRGFLPLSCAGRRLRSRNQPGRRRKFADRGNGLNWQTGSHFRSVLVRILLP
jgi:hypothetical protein